MVSASRDKSSSLAEWDYTPDRMAEGETQSGTGQASFFDGPGGEQDLLPTTLIDRYEIERRLGAGGMGVVYAARDIHLGRTVAVKVVGSWIDAGSGQDRLVREAQAMAKLRHPNLATVYDIGVSNERLFVVMELVDGGTVADWLKAEPRSWRAILAVYLQAARGLAAANAAGFVHRDFKPENVLFGKDGVARVSDFGVARLLGDAERAVPAGDEAAEGSVTRTGGVVGTPGYIAPEILRHEPVDGRADQFSFCVAVYASLHGERPFEPLQGPGRIAETLGRRRPPRAGIGPRWLQRIVVRGLASDPRDRWPTIDALAAAIERRLVRRRRALVLTAIGLTAVAATALVMWKRSTPAPPPDWSPVVIGREGKDSPSGMVVSPDGSTLATIAPTEAWIEPRAGAGTRRRVAFPFPAKVLMCRLSRTGDRLFCSFDLGPGGVEIWALDVATGQAQRRAPPVAAPTVKPSKLFDVGPDESMLFVALDLTTLWRVDTTGAVQRVVTAEPGQLLAGCAWSPDGTRFVLRVRSPERHRTDVKVMTPGTGAVAVVSHRICNHLEWLTENSLACDPRTFRNPVVIELLLPSGAGEATERVRYSGPEYQQLSGLSASSAGVLLSISPNDKHLGLLALDAPGSLGRIASGSITHRAGRGGAARRPGGDPRLRSVPRGREHDPVLRDAHRPEVPRW